MKLCKKGFEKNGPGFVSLIAEEPEDMWHVYNLIRVGDVVRSATIRKVVSESATGTTSSQRVHTTLTIQVESIDFDPGANALHLKGKNIVENELVRMGAYHTLDIEPNRKFTLNKNEWDTIDLERLDVALDPAAAADVAAVVMKEGLANICLITPAMTLLRQRIEVTIPRKRKGFTSQHEKGMERFLDAVSAGILRHINLQQVKCVLIASSGFTNQQLMTHLLTYADKEGRKITGEEKGKFLLIHSSNGHVHALKEVLEDPAVASRLADTKAQGEVKALQTFYTLMGTDPERAFYGYNHVMHANREKAIELLMISDKLFRSQSIQERKKYVRLVESVREENGTVLIFSSMHESGKRLDELTGCAAILRFPMPELEDEPLSDPEEQTE